MRGFRCIAALTLPLAVSALRFQGLFTDETTGNEIEIFTTDDVVLTREETMAYYYNNLNQSTELTLQPREAHYTSCETWSGHDGITGGGGCKTDHSFNLYMEEMGEERTRGVIAQLIFEAGHVALPQKDKRWRCALSSSWKHSQLCFSWGFEMHNSFAQDHVDRIVDFAVFCAGELKSSAQIVIDDTTGYKRWLCISDRPRRCQNTVCKWDELTKDKTDDKAKPKLPAMYDDTPREKRPQLPAFSPKPENEEYV